MKILFTALFTGVFFMAQAQNIRLSNYIQSADSKSFSAKLIQPEGSKFEPAGPGKKLCKISSDEVTLTPSAEKTLAKKGRLDLPFASASGEKITFTIIQDRFEKNKVIAHRGAWKEKNLPENSLASLKEASAIGCTGSEFDVHMTADSVIVVNHDPEFKGMKIEESTYKQLLTKKHENGEPIPTLEAYLKTGMKQQKTRLILEIKASKISKQRTIALTDKVLKMVSDLQAQAWVEYISFDDDALRHILQITPEVRVQSLDGKMSPEQLKSDRFYGADYHFSVYQKQPDFIQEAHNRGLKINAWTVNEEKDMREMLEKGADFITTNFPNLLLKLDVKQR